MAQVREKQLANEKLHTTTRKALERLRNQWEGLPILVDRPESPLDDNTFENRLRSPVVGTRDHSGSGSVCSGMFSFVMSPLLHDSAFRGVPSTVFRDIQGVP